MQGPGDGMLSAHALTRNSIEGNCTHTERDRTAIRVDLAGVEANVLDRHDRLRSEGCVSDESIRQRPISSLAENERGSTTTTGKDVEYAPSFSSYRSTSSLEIPARARTLGIANAGPMPISFGSTPVTEVMTNLPRIGRPSSCALERRVRRTAAAPSETCASHVSMIDGSARDKPGV